MSGLRIVIQTPKGPCEGTARYGREASANKACEAMSMKGVVGLTSYACDSCGGWHIGHPVNMDAVLEDLKKTFRDMGIEIID